MSQGSVQTNRPVGEGYAIYTNFGDPIPCQQTEEQLFHLIEVRLSDTEWYLFRPDIANLGADLQRLRGHRPPSPRPWTSPDAHPERVSAMHTKIDRASMPSASGRKPQHTAAAPRPRPAPEDPSEFLARRAGKARPCGAGGFGLADRPAIPIGSTRCSSAC